ncbi:splicing factor Slu7 [Schizosaccharomyces cryophilus OY26]|uniref:Pre-mRNA-splicing factor SLU7 n=1 Tax=Schizosaccharomyces cryophilus (strain OY26 / ATCC MYA-4695 / CBS 11777 / NBRC 106824 / NRRL Y48691) TaxID=653667 RepID=S9VZL3_SCHCR|nr:splicing factor Slu7 [Schizosaccharomyces cryophilus OY26]EPY51654.1 splicing factor Slu7 [Schizosaccharomyces cryophilus OY26]
MSYMNNTFQSNYDYSKDNNFMSTDIGPSMRELKVQNRRSRPMENPGADNPYIPKFISTAPWYAQDEQAVERLAHQRLGKKEPPSGGRSSIEESWYARGKRAGPAATKYRKGACENCGAMSHKLKDCMERPRKRGARWTGKDIQADEVIQEVDVSWDAKRDRWNGFDASDYKKVIERYEKMDALQQMHNSTERQTEGTDNFGKDTPSSTNKEESNGGADSGVTTPSLRMREDVVGYLRTDNKGLQYEPKSRSMRDTTGSHLLSDSTNGSGFIKASGGDKEDFEKLQTFAWEAERSGNRVHVVANPTAGELEYRKNRQSKAVNQKQIEQSILEKYGDGTAKRKRPAGPSFPSNSTLDSAPSQQDVSKKDDSPQRDLKTEKPTGTENVTILEGDL